MKITQMWKVNRRQQQGMQSENNLVKFDVEKLNTGRLVHLCLLPLSAIVSAIT
jgi:hypothetical protein